MRRNLLHVKQIILVPLLSLLTFLSWTSLVFSQWVVVNPPQVSQDWNLWGVSFADPSNGWAVGGDITNKRGVLLAYPGNSWTGPYPVSVSSANWSLIGVDVASAGGGWAVGYDEANSSGVFLHYLNGQWTPVASPQISTDWELADVQMLSPTEGWAVGYDQANKIGVLLHYINGNWQLVAAPAIISSNKWYLMGVHFTSASEGWAVGYDQINKTGVLLHYLNGRWASVVPPPVSSDWELLSVHFTSSGQGWAVGWDHFNKRGVILRYAAPETITQPNLPDGPTSGDTNTSYFFSTGGSVSSIGDSIQYRFDWGDQSKSGWLPVGVINAPKSWAAPGSYVVKAQALCAKHQVVSDWSEGVSVNISGIYFPIALTSPIESSLFDACSLYVPPTFEWTAEEPFKSYEIQFSLDSDFGKIWKKIKATSTSLFISSALWKGVLLLPGKSGGIAYWRVVGTRADKTIAISQPFSILAGSPKPVQNPSPSTTSRTALPELTWDNACNVKFKIWFGNDPNLTKKTTLNFSVKNPLDNGGVFQATLTSRQWETIRKLIGDKTGGALYWYIECWDGLGRYYKTDTMSFSLTE